MDRPVAPRLADEDPAVQWFERPRAGRRLRLIGTVLGDQRGVFAIVEELSSKQQSLYHLHDSVLDLGEVTEIRRNGIIIRQGNVEELLELGISEGLAAQMGAPSAIPGPQTAAALMSPLRKVVDRREVEQAMNDLPKLLSQARAVPNTVNGAINGFRLDYIAPASFYEKSGSRLETCCSGSMASIFEIQVPC